MHSNGKIIVGVNSGLFNTPYNTLRAAEPVNAEYDLLSLNTIIVFFKLLSFKLILHGLGQF